jgi:hypothetical protein
MVEILQTILQPRTPKPMPQLPPNQKRMPPPYRRGGEKMNKKIKTATLIFLTLIIGALTADAAVQIWSNRVNVTVQQPTLTLSASTPTILTGQSESFTGNLASSGIPLPNKKIWLFCDGINTTLSAITDTSGNYQILWPATTSGTHTFNATVSMP